jgi:transcriptional regulator with XRE-family HTH domain
MFSRQEFAKARQESVVHPVDTTNLPIGRALKVERVAAGVALGTVAESVGISAGHLSRIEKGERIASDELVERIRAAVRAAGATA